ncbi:MAG TPA: helix-hairpin-helix domain-containing protein [Polyangiaceae bacterium]|nr:helix-hairpin-helix domain-containing protein [Polyangiaceae bacterium]
MQLFETESERSLRDGRRSTGNTSPARRGEGPKRALAAARALAAGARARRLGVWGPVLAKGAAILGGMLALAAIGASSLSRGAGVTLPTDTLVPAPASAGPRAGGAAPAHHASVTRAGVVPLAGAPEPSAGPSALDDAAPDGGVPTPPAGASPGLTADGKVILNRADASDLRHLPGVGPKRAEAIIALRAKLGGRFKRITDLLRVKGIGPKGLKKIEPHVVLDEPKQS